MVAGIWMRRAVVTGTVLMAGLAVPAADQRLSSRWQTLDIAVDGDPTDWPPLVALDEAPAVAATNDGEFFYLVVSSDDPAVVNLIATGLIVWIDPAGKKAQTFGVWVPGVIDRPLPGATPDVEPDAALRGVSTEVLDRFDLLGPGKNQRRLVDVTPDLAIELASGVREGQVIYELKLPLERTDARPYAVGAPAGKTIGLGLATPEAPQGSRRGPLVGSSGRVGGASPTYIPGVTPYRPGAGGQGFAAYRERPDREDPLEVWTTLTLAPAPGR